MRRTVLAAIIATAPTSLFAATFDLSLDDLNGERTVVIARSGDGVFAAAAGRADLKVLTGADAERARASLISMADEAPDGSRNTHGESGSKRKIVVHKMDVDEDDDALHDEERRTVRIPKSTDGPRREETLLNEDAEALIEDETEGADERRVIRLKGVDEADAIRFIDDIKGLDSGERAQMKAAVGL